MQELIQLFREIADIGREEVSESQTELIALFVDCGVVELVLKIWKEFQDQKMLEQNIALPPHVDESLTVIHYTLCIMHHRCKKR